MSLKIRETEILARTASVLDFFFFWLGIQSLKEIFIYYLFYQQLFKNCNCLVMCPFNFFLDRVSVCSVDWPHNPPTSTSQVLELPITGVHHHAQLPVVF
jgi:hypothetical protein